MLDADGWRNILVSNSYGTSNTDLRTAFANVIKKTSTDKIAVNKDKEETSPEAFLAYRLIPLDKNPVLCPAGVGKVL